MAASRIIHILARQARTIALSDWIKELKRVTSLWIKERSPEQREFQWQAGYGAFSVSQSKRGQVRQYIESQAEHHKALDFQAEFRKLLERHGLEWVERYVWD